MRSVQRVYLGDHQLSPGKTHHSIVGPNGPTPIPSSTHLEMATPSLASTDIGFYLLHICADGQVADTWRQTIDEAHHQVEYELGVKSHEWEYIEVMQG